MESVAMPFYVWGSWGIKCVTIFKCCTIHPTFFWMRYCFQTSFIKWRNLFLISGRGFSFYKSSVLVSNDAFYILYSFFFYSLLGPVFLRHTMYTSVSFIPNSIISVMRSGLKWDSLFLDQNISSALYVNECLVFSPTFFFISPFVTFYF